MSRLSGSGPGPLRVLALAGAAWTVSETWVRLVLRFGVLVVLSRLLTPLEVGVFASVGVVMALFSSVGGLGLRSALVQSREVSQRQTQIALGFSIVSSLAGGALIFGLAPLAEAFFRIDELTLVLRVSVLSYVLEGISGLAEALLQRKLQFRTLAILHTSGYLAGPTLTAVGLAFLGFGVWALVLGQLVGSAVKLLFIVRMGALPRGLSFRFAGIARLLHYGIGLTLGNLANQLALQGDNLVVGRVLGANALGLYNRAYTVISMPASLFSSAVDRVLFAVLSSVQEDRDRLASALQRNLMLVCWLAVPVGVFTALLAEEIVLVMLGQQWTQTTAPLRILALGLFFRLAYKVSGTLVRSVGAVYKGLLRQILYALTLILACFIGAQFGLAGVAIGVLLSLALHFALLTRLASGLVGLSWSGLVDAVVPGLTTGILVALVAAASGLLADRLVLSPWSSLVLSVLLTAGTTLVAIWRFSALFAGPIGSWWLRVLRERSAVPDNRDLITRNRDLDV